VKRVYHLTTRLGRTVRATGNHKFLTIDGWKRLDQLTEGSHVALPRVLAGPSEQTLHHDLGNAFCGTGLYKQNISRDRAARLAQAVQSPTIANLAESNIYWDRIVSIEPDGETDVYDLTVPGNSNFVGDNFILHNSIEQDSDVVMFLYRDVMYNEATEFPNQADVIVSKHRNGPTGTVSLYFDRTITKFMDASVRRVDLSDL
jgi:replicative DNA helicase